MSRYHKDDPDAYDKMVDDRMEDRDGYCEYRGEDGAKKKGYTGPFPKDPIQRKAGFGYNCFLGYKEGAILQRCWKVHMCPKDSY